MKRYWFLLLLCAGVAFPQTKHAPAKPDDDKIGQDLISIGHIVAINGTDEHGCDWSFQWDESTGSCAVTVTFTSVGKITCSPIITSKEGQHVVCWYRPESKKESPK